METLKSAIEKIKEKILAGFINHESLTLDQIIKLSGLETTSTKGISIALEELEYNEAIVQDKAGNYSLKLR